MIAADDVTPPTQGSEVHFIRAGADDFGYSSSPVQ